MPRTEVPRSPSPPDSKTTTLSPKPQTAPRTPPPVGPYSSPTHRDLWRSFGGGCFLSARYPCKECPTHSRGTSARMGGTSLCSGLGIRVQEKSCVEGSTRYTTSLVNPPPASKSEIRNSIPKARTSKLETRAPTRSPNVEGKGVDGAEGPGVQHRPMALSM